MALKMNLLHLRYCISYSCRERAINDMLHLSDADQSSLFEVIEDYFDEQSNSQNDVSDSDDT